jgi:hypothetical protein
MKQNPINPTHAIRPGSRKKRRRTLYYNQNHPGTRRRDPWSAAEDAKIIEGGCSDREMAVVLGRSISAIQTRRSILKRVIRLKKIPSKTASLPANNVKK